MAREYSQYTFNTRNSVSWNEWKIDLYFLTIFELKILWNNCYVPGIASHTKNIKITETKFLPFQIRSIDDRDYMALRGRAGEGIDPLHLYFSPNPPEKLQSLIYPEMEEKVIHKITHYSFKFLPVNSNPYRCCNSLNHYNSSRSYC